MTKAEWLDVLKVSSPLALPITIALLLRIKFIQEPLRALVHALDTAWVTVDRKANAAYEVMKVPLKIAGALLVLAIAWAGINEYRAVPHPKPRIAVLFKEETIVTVDGVSDDGWLKDCLSGYRRHIVGDYTIVDDDKTPLVCAGERHYEDWIKEKEKGQK